MAKNFVCLRYHLVFATKNRAELITPELREDLYAYIGGIINHFNGALLAAGGMPDHVHLLAGFRPRYSLSKMLKEIKGGSSRWVNELPGRDEVFAWQEGYGTFSVSESQVPTVRRYIQRQEEHHRRMSLREEIEQLLKRHQITYAERDLEGF